MESRVHTTERTESGADPSFPAPDDLKLLSITQVLEILGVSRVAFYELRRKGRFPKPVQVGQSPRWRVTAVRAWMDAGGSKPVDKQVEGAS